jgi:uncharacterized protein (DUF2336 family)
MLWSMTSRLEDLAREFSAARADSAKLRPRLAAAQKKLTELRPQIADAIVEAAREGMRQADIVRITGYTRERVRQICRGAGVEPIE